MNKRDSLLSYISDAHKDAYGFRPHGKYADLTVEELEVVADELSDAVCESIAEEQAAERRNQARFESSIATAIEAGAADRATAVRWLLDAEGLAEESTGYIQFTLGVGYYYDINTGTEVAA